MSWDMYDMTQKIQVVVVAIVLPLVILAASLWHDWVEEGQSPKARKVMKDWNWNIDEMAHAINVKGRLIGYRVLQAGVIIYLGYSRFFRDYRGDKRIFDFFFGKSNHKARNCPSVYYHRNNIVLPIQINLLCRF